KLDRRARWGLVLQGLAYSLLWQNKFWERSPEDWRVASCVPFFVLAALFSWSGVRALGRQWRIDAGLNSGHARVRSGGYHVVRPPPDLSLHVLHALRHGPHDHAPSHPATRSDAVHSRHGGSRAARRNAAGLAFRRCVPGLSVRGSRLHSPSKALLTERRSCQS